jgi:hypothetical protein
MTSEVSVVIERIWACADESGGEVARVHTSTAEGGCATRAAHNPKLIGERAELLFMYEAARRGFVVSKPFGDSAKYDVVVESRKRPGKMWRVQVRSVTRRNGRSYKIDCRTGCRRRKMVAEDADFLAAYCGPEERWYIVPVRAFAPCNHISLFPHVEESEGRFERYREAWSLMGKIAEEAPSRLV